MNIMIRSTQFRGSSKAHKSGVVQAGIHLYEPWIAVLLKLDMLYAIPQRLWVTKAAMLSAARLYKATGLPTCTAGHLLRRCVLRYRYAMMGWLPLAFYRIVFQLEHLLCIGFFGKVIYMIYRPVRQVTRSASPTLMPASAVL